MESFQPSQVIAFEGRAQPCEECDHRKGQKERIFCESWSRKTPLYRIQSSADAGCQNCDSIAKGLQLWAAANSVEYDEIFVDWMEDKDCVSTIWRPLHVGVEIRIMRGRGRQIARPLYFDLIMYVHEG
jgi:hypothetical protein